MAIKKALRDQRLFYSDETNKCALSLQPLNNEFKQGHEWEPKSSYYVLPAQNMGLPKGGDPHGNGVFLLAYNAHQLNGLKRIMELSLARTLANKFKTTVNKIFKKYKTTRETDGQSYKVLQTEVTREGKKPLVTYFGGFKLGFKKDAVIEDALPTGKVYNIKSQLIERLLNTTMNNNQLDI